VSVVVPLFNKEATVRRALLSVARQSCRPLEVLIVDDASADKSVREARTFGEPPFRLIAREVNGGASAARNTGIACARGDLVAFLDADDEWHPEFLAAIVEMAAAFPQAGAYCTGHVLIRAPKRLREVSYPSATNAGGPFLLPDYFECHLSGQLMSASSTAVWRHVLLQAGMFPGSDVIGEDVRLWTRIAFRHPIAHNPRLLCTYHLEGDDHLSQSSGRWQYEELGVVNDLTALLETGESCRGNRAAIEAYRALHTLSVCRRRLLAGQCRETRALLWKYRLPRVFPLTRFFLLMFSYLPPRAVAACRWVVKHLLDLAQFSDTSVFRTDSANHL
jgi:hypothetical protein